MSILAIAPSRRHRASAVREITIITAKHFLPCGAMLARYMLSLCVCLSVRHKLVLYWNNWTSGAVFSVWRLPFTSTTLCCKVIWVSPKIRVLPSGNLSQTLDCFLGVRKSIQPVKIEWWSVDVVIFLERGADCLHMVQLMPLNAKTPSSFASFKSRLVLSFCYRIAQFVLEK